MTDEPKPFQDIWLTKALAGHVRKDVASLPGPGSICYYGNPLGAMANNPDDFISDHLLPAVNLWANLTGIGSGPKFPTAITCFQIAKPRAYALIVFWEWLAAIQRGDPSENEPRLRLFATDEDSCIRQDFVYALWEGYVHAMDRALSFQGIDNVNAQLSAHIPVEGLESIAQIASDLRNRSKPETLVMRSVPAHVGLMLLPFLRLRKGSPFRGKDLQDLYLAGWNLAELGCTFSTPGGLSNKQWPLGGRQQAARGLAGSRTAQLIRAVAIETLLSLRNHTDWHSAWEENMPPNTTSIITTTPQKLADQIGLGKTGPNRFASNRNLERLTEVTVTWPNDVLLLTCAIPARDWMLVNLHDTVGLIRVVGFINGELRSEVVYGKVLDMRDHDSTPDTLELDVCTLGVPARLMRHWDRAAPTERHITGFATISTAFGTERLIIGVDAYFGELDLPPT